MPRYLDVVNGKGPKLSFVDDRLQSAEHSLPVARIRADAFSLAMRECRTTFEKVIKTLIHLPIRFYTFRQKAFNEMMLDISSSLIEKCSNLEKEYRLLQKRIVDLEKEIARFRPDKPVLPIGPKSYFAFENKFRGSENEIKERQGLYLPFLKKVSAAVLDIGCGRGELLELLHQGGIDAYGVDSNPEMVAHCMKKNLKVECQDAFVHLGMLKDSSLGAVVALHFIEHLSKQRAVSLIKLCYDKIQPGGVFILETPNPQDFLTHISSFHLDLSHITPLHPETVRFLTQAAGFSDCQIRFLSPYPAEEMLETSEVNALPQAEKIYRNFQKLNKLLFAYRDFSVICKK
jgi:O-antigen chain-terminating methyltransferase